MSEVPQVASNACAGLSEADAQRLAEAAANLVAARGIMMRMVEFVGSALNQMGGRAAGLALKALGERGEAKIQEIVHDILWRAYGAATAGLDPASEREPWDWLHKTIVSASGAAAGIIGLPGLGFDLPITTGMIIRSLAEIARAHGEDIGSDECRRACLEVLVIGGPETEDDEIEIGYWSTRAALGQVGIQNLVSQAAKRFGIALSHKVSAQLVPAIGALAGGSLNYIFMDYYQQMARVHFAIREIERRSGDPDSVRACFDRLVREAREAKRLGKPDKTP
jgi:hypothetical protein